MLELKNISYSVQDEGTGKVQDILKDVCLTFDDATISVITGPNGSGKSTLIKILMGFVRPTAGTILFNGEDVTDLSVTERARKGFTIAFQQPVRFKGITVQKLLELASGKRMDTDAMCECLSSVGLCARNYIGRAVDGTLFGRRAQAHRAGDRHRQGRRGVFAGRAGGGHRSLELRGPRQGVRAAA